MSEEAKLNETEQTEGAESPAPDAGQNLPKMLSSLEGAPSKELIEAWKAKHGEVYISGFSETELFVWRPLRRGEYINLQAVAQEKDLNQYQLEEATCDLCVLWPQGPRKWQDGKAGTPHTLSEQILYNSNFYTPAAASMLVFKL